MSTSSLETEYKNEKIQVSVKRLPGCIVDMTITATPEFSKETYTQAVKEVRKEISIPGFRRGKVPETTVLQKFSTQVDREWREIFLNAAVKEAIVLSHLYPRTDDQNRPAINQIKTVSISKENNSSFNVIYEILPDQIKIDISKISYPGIQKKVITEKECEDRLEELRISKASWEELNDTTIEDRGFADIITAEEESDSDGSDSEPTRVWVRKDSLPEELYNNLLGLKTGDTFIDVVDKSEQNPDGKRVKITVKAILNANLPEVNDEFSSQFGAKSTEELKENIKKSLEKDAERAYYEQSSNQIILQLLEIAPMDVPNSMIAKQATIVARQVERNLEKSAPESSAEDRSRTLKDLKQMIDKRATEIVHLRHLMHQLAKEHKIGVTNDEFQKEMSELSSMIRYGMHPFIRETDDPQELAVEVYNQMLTYKVLNFLIDQMKKK